MNNEKKLGQEPAFPEEFLYGRDNQLTGHRNGMSKRFYAACTAMQGLIASTASEESFPNPKYIAERSFDFADELLRQEDE